MNQKDKIYSVNKEASLYRSQGMYEESLEKYKELLELVKNYKALKNKDDLENKIKVKISGVIKKLNYYEKENPEKNLSDDKKEIIKKLFTKSRNDPDFDKFEEALTLAKFGQFEDAVKEMTPFIKNEKLRPDAVRNIVKCYKELGREDEIKDLLSSWESENLINGKQALKISNTVFSDKNTTIQKKEEPPVLRISEDIDSPEIMEIDSVGIKLGENSGHGSDQIELDVSFQTGNHLSLIISSKEKTIIDNLDVGVKLNEMCFYSPIAVFKSSGIVLSKHQIKNGPKKGDWCMDIEIKNPA